MFQMLLTMMLVFGSVIESDPPSKPTGYESLAISSEESWKIGEILRTMAENNVMALLFERKRLERLGDEIRHVHPIRFIGTVFADADYTRYMFIIRQSGFKWNGFIDGFKERFKEEIKAGNVRPHLAGLARSLSVDETRLAGYVDEKDFEGMVLYLMRMSRKNRRS